MTCKSSPGIEITDGTSNRRLLGEKTISDYYFDGLEYGDELESGKHGQQDDISRQVAMESRLRPRLPLRTIHLYRTPAAFSTTPASAVRIPTV